MFYKPYITSTQKGYSINKYTLLWDGEWWACQKGQRQLVFQGEDYEKICEVQYHGREGVEVFGIVIVKKFRNLGKYNYEFVFVKEELLAAHAFISGNLNHKFNFKKFYFGRTVKLPKQEYSVYRNVNKS